MLGTEPSLIDTYVKSGQLQLQFGHVLDHGDSSLNAHAGSMCGAEQGQFWPLHDALFEQQSSLFGGGTADAVKQIAADQGLDSAAFNACLDEGRHVAAVQQQDEARRSLGIRTRPTLDINGQLVIGAQSFETLQGIIDGYLAQ